MALLGAGRRERHPPPPPKQPARISSRLLPVMLDPAKLEARGTLAILDFGRANSSSLEYFNQYPCRLCVLDAAESLLAWSQGVESRAEADNPPSLQQMQHELAGLLESLGSQRFDLVFLWDTLNHLPAAALPAFSGLLRRHLTAGAKGHGFILHKREAEHSLRRMGLGEPGEIALLHSQPTPLHFHTRKAVNETLAPDLAIDHAVLHGDGRLEYLLSAASGR